MRQRIRTLIGSKVEGREVRESETAPPRAKVVDLMEALRASLEKRATAKTAASPARPAAARRSLRKAG